MKIIFGGRPGDAGSEMITRVENKSQEIVSLTATIEKVGTPTRTYEYSPSGNPPQQLFEPELLEAGKQYKVVFTVVPDNSQRSFDLHIWTEKGEEKKVIYPLPGDNNPVDVQSGEPLASFNVIGV